MSKDSPSKNGDGLVRCLVADPKLTRHLASGNLQFEELEYSEPLRTGDAAQANPPAGELSEGVITPAASPATIRQSVQFSTTTTGANSVTQFEAILRHIISSRGFA
jgi:hypothetical protein